MNYTEQDREYLKSLTVLFVEDDDEAREQFSRFLTRFTSRLVVARDGAEGVKAYEDHIPDIIITDIEMPVMDGITMSRRIRRANFTGPVIFLTAYDSDDYRLKSADISLDRYVTKPVDLHHLHEVLLRSCRLLRLEEKFKKDSGLRFRELKKFFNAEVPQPGSNGEFLKLAPEAVINGVWDWDPRTGTCYCSPSYFRMLGYEPGEFIEKISTGTGGLANFFGPDKETMAFSAAERVMDTLIMVDAVLKADNISIHVANWNTCIVKGFPNQYTRVLLNLLNNSRDAILAKGAAARHITIDITKQDGTGIVSISDNGGGIHENILKRIFDPYFSTRGLGSGMGLYMSKMIIECNMNGTLSARNIDGGAEFLVAVPLEETVS